MFFRISEKHVNRDIDNIILLNSNTVKFYRVSLYTISYNVSLLARIDNNFDQQYISFNYTKKSDPVQRNPNFNKKAKTIQNISLLLTLTIFFLCKLKRVLKKHQIFLLLYLTFITISGITNWLQKLTPDSNFEIFRKSDFFSYESIKLYNRNFDTHLDYSFKILVLKNPKYKNYTNFFQLLLLISGDIRLNPGPKQLSNINNLSKIFRKRGLHFIHLNINSLLLKIDEVRNIAKVSGASVIGVSESKLDNSILNEELNIQGYDLLRCDRNRHGGGVACYIKQNICYNTKNIFSTELENIFFDVFLPKTKPFSFGIFYRPPSQNNFLELVSTNFDKLYPESNEIFILGDMNINILHQGKNVLDAKSNTKSNSTAITSICKHYMEFCSMFGLKQLIKSPTPITCNTATLIDHILTNSTNKISQPGIIETGISDHQMIYCTRKIQRQKFNKHKYIKCRSFKNYSTELFQEELKSSQFPNYNNFDNVDNAYTNFVERLLLCIDKTAPIKEIRIKNRSQVWFDGEIAEAITKRNKPFQKFKKSRLNIDHEIYKESKYYVQNLIKQKKRTHFENKLTENIGKPKDLWKTLKSLGLPNKTAPNSNIYLEKEGKIQFDSASTAEIFKDYFSNLAENLVKKLPAAPKRFLQASVELYYKRFDLTNKSFVFPLCPIMMC